jgi:putative CocE/NonD family hydrolase
MSAQANSDNTYWIKLPDGRRLSARAWLPKSHHPHPAILEYLPYRKRDGTAERDATTHAYFVEHGYACIRVDIAGTGDSEGQFDDEYSEQELSDGEAVLEWIARQDWCDGSIGIIGISWGGFNGLQLAHRRPPSLKAVVTVASTADRYADDIHYMGGCLLSDNANWGATMLAYLSRPADPLLRQDWREDWIARMENMPDLTSKWLKHQTRDEYWKHGSICEDYSRINIPVLAVTGWADAYVNTPGYLAEHLNTCTKALIGPWEHRYPHLSKLGAADFCSEVLAWFDRWLKDQQNGVENLPDYRVFCKEFAPPTRTMTPPKGRWVAEIEWPSPNITEKDVFLNGGALTDEAGHGQAIISNPAHVGMASGYFCPGMRFDNELAADQAEDDALSAHFDMNLPEDLEIMGQPRLKIAFRVDQPVAQIVARLCEVDNNGVSQRITYRPFNLTHGQSHETPSAPIHEMPSALIPGQRYIAEFPLNACAHRLQAKHRLRLSLSTSYWPIVWPSPKPVTITVEENESVLTLPVRNNNKITPPAHPAPIKMVESDSAIKIRPSDGWAKDYTEPDGTIIQESFDDFGQSQDRIHGMNVSSHVNTRYSIHPGDPTRASLLVRWNFSYQRDDWQVEIDTSSHMTCDHENFYLHRKLRAMEGAVKTELLNKEWSEAIPRGLL